MLAIPAIDLRHTHGATGASTGASTGAPTGAPNGGATGEGPERAEYPLEVARRWVAAGFSRLHLMDLDAESDRGENRLLVFDIIREMHDLGGVTVQVGGGVRETEDILALLRDGAEQVVVGQRGTDDPGWLDTHAALAPGRLLLTLELLQRRVASRGRASAPQRAVEDIISEIDHLPLAGLLVRALCKDGKHLGADLATLEDLASSVPWPLIALGGVESMQDLRNLEVRGVAAVVLGSELHSEALDPRVVAEEFQV